MTEVDQVTSGDGGQVAQEGERKGACVCVCVGVQVRECVRRLAVGWFSGSDGGG